MANLLFPLNKLMSYPLRCGHMAWNHTFWSNVMGKDNCVRQLNGIGNIAVLKSICSGKSFNILAYVF